MKQAKMSLEFLHIGLRSTVVGAANPQTFLNTNNGKDLSSIYNTTVNIIVDPNIQQKEVGVAPGSRVAGTYGSINYRVSGVTNGNIKKADNGAR